eukprot:scaffold31381_cov54-Phaeocystis_antarctica.AAC.1
MRTPKGKPKGRAASTAAVAIDGADSKGKANDKEVADSWIYALHDSHATRFRDARPLTGSVCGHGKKPSSRFHRGVTDQLLGEGLQPVVPLRDRVHRAALIEHQSEVNLCRAGRLGRGWRRWLRRWRRRGPAALATTRAAAASATTRAAATLATTRAAAASATTRAAAASARTKVVRVVAGTGTRCRPCTPLGSRLRMLWRRKPCQRRRCRRTRGCRWRSGTPSAGRCC